MPPSQEQPVAAQLDPTDRDAIAQVKYRYLRGVDAKDWDLLASTLTADAVAHYGGGAEVVEGRDEIVDFLRQRLDRDSLHTAHRVTHPELVADGPDRATGRWAMHDVVLDSDHRFQLTGAGWYEDAYVRTDGGWRIAATGATRTYELTQPWVQGARLTASAWQTGGRTTMPY